MSRARTAGSATSRGDHAAFREATAGMRQEVVESRAETQRVKDQLNCLIMLVRRAWTGDQAAAVHVANIAGVAPPTPQQEDPAIQHKLKYIHHWAMLTLGLLNQHYHRLEEHALALAKKRLQQRQEYLDDQLQQHEVLLKNLPRVPRKLPEQAELQKPSFFMTYSNPSVEGYQADTEKASSTSLLEFLYPGNELKMGKRTSRDPGKTDSSKSKLFAVPDELNKNSKTKRPPSARLLKKADAQRARPRSGDVVKTIKGERPMKYEATHLVPVKAKSRSKSAKTAASPSTPSEGRRPWVAAALVKDGDGYTLDVGGEYEVDRSRREGPMSMEESVSEEIRKIEKMEDNFKETTKLLQHKLGISNTGAV